jgi:hypothetical protein
MRPHHAFWLICVGGAVLALGAADPATAPSDRSLLGGKIQFTPPHDWKYQQSNADDSAIFIAPDHDGVMVISVLPPQASIKPEAALAMVRQLRMNHQKAGQEMVAPPKIGRDPRFAIRIQEKYRTRDGKVADELHLFREVGKRAVSLTVQSISTEEDRIAAVHKQGEETLISANEDKK